MRLRSALIATALLLPVALVFGVESPADAAARASVYVYSPASSTVRVRVSEGPNSECDSSQNAMRYDGPIQSGQTLKVPIFGPCVCVSSTSTSFPDSEWSQGQRFCPASAYGYDKFARRRLLPSDFTVRLDGR